MSIAVVALFLAQVAAEPSPAAPGSSDIVITGTRPATKPKATLGSRIARKREPDPRGFVSQISSDTGVAGLTPGSGMDPFAGGTRNVTVKSCRSSNKQLSAASLCALAAIQKRVTFGDADGAREAIRKLVVRPDATPLDRFFAHRFGYLLAERQRDDRWRETSLAAMVETGALGRSDDLAARRTLAAMALKRDDSDAAIALLRRVAELAPDDARSRGNLGALYAARGAHRDARAQLNAAVAITRTAGNIVPQSWIEYLARTD